MTSKTQAGPHRVPGWRRPNVRFGSEVDILTLRNNVRFTPNSGHSDYRVRCPLCARTRLVHRSKQALYRLSRGSVVTSDFAPNYQIQSASVGSPLAPFPPLGWRPYAVRHGDSRGNPPRDVGPKILVLGPKLLSKHRLLEDKGVEGEPHEPAVCHERQVAEQDRLAQNDGDYGNVYSTALGGTWLTFGHSKFTTELARSCTTYEVRKFISQRANSLAT